MRLKDADALIDKFKNKDANGINLVLDKYAIKCIEDAPTIEPERKWIPCSERLPEYSGRYLVSVLDGIDRRTTVAPYHPQSRTWSLTGRMAYWKVVAWCELPEPWKGEDNGQ